MSEQSITYEIEERDSGRPFRYRVTVYVAGRHVTSTIASTRWGGRWWARHKAKELRKRDGELFREKGAL